MILQKEQGHKIYIGRKFAIMRKYFSIDLIEKRKKSGGGSILSVRPLTVVFLFPYHFLSLDVTHVVELISIGDSSRYHAQV